MESALEQAQFKIVLAIAKAESSISNVALS